MVFSPLDETSQNFIARIDNKKAVIAVIGLGYVGLPLMLGYHAHGFPVLGLDIDEQKITDLHAGKSYFNHIPDESIAPLLEGERFSASTDFSRIAEADAILICVPTPLNAHHEPDISYVTGTAEKIAPFLRKGQLVVLESTTYPGTTRDVMTPILEQDSGLAEGQDFVAGYSPEREDPGNQDFGTTTIPKVVGASTRQGQAMLESLYGALVPHVVTVSSPETAEAVKLTENIFRAVNIAMVNELKQIFTRMDIDIWEVIDAAKTKPFGYMPFYPGPGLGGHCIPIDPFYLTWKAREYGEHTRFIELAGEINTNMPRYVITRLAEALSDRFEKAVKGSKILLVGMSYKEDIDDTRESPSLELVRLLKEKGADVSYYDPFVPVLPKTRKYPLLEGMKSISWNLEQVGEFDAVLVSTRHSGIDWKALVTHARLVVDTRNIGKDLPPELKAKIVKA